MAEIQNSGAQFEPETIAFDTDTPAETHYYMPSLFNHDVHQLWKKFRVQFSP